MKHFFSTPNNSSVNNISKELQAWTQAINTLIEIITDPSFDSKYPGLTKKDIIDLTFDKGSLATMAKIPREELRNKFYFKFENR